MRLTSAYTTHKPMGCGKANNEGAEANYQKSRNRYFAYRASRQTASNGVANDSGFFFPTKSEIAAMLPPLVALVAQH